MLYTRFYQFKKSTNSFLYIIVKKDQVSLSKISPYPKFASNKIQLRTQISLFSILSPQIDQRERIDCLWQNRQNIGLTLKLKPKCKSECFTVILKKLRVAWFPYLKKNVWFLITVLVKWGIKFTDVSVKILSALCMIFKYMWFDQSVAKSCYNSNCQQISDLICKSNLNNLTC